MKQISANSTIWLAILGALVLSFTSCEKKTGNRSGSSQRNFITIGTGGVTGVYYPTGGAICGMVNQNSGSLDIKCNVESTAGSLYNTNSIKSEALDIGVVQSDVGFNAWRGNPPFKERHQKLRSLFSIHSESVTLVARADANINKLGDLKGKRVNVGNPGSGTRRTVDRLFEACGINKSELSLAGELKPAEMPDALRDQKLDAYFYIVGHPTANVKDIATSTAVKVVPIEGPCVDKLVSSYPYYVKTKIPGGLYQGNEQDIPSYGVKATLLSSTNLSVDVAYQLVKAVLSNLDAFKKLHPSYSQLTQKSMLEGLSAPLHRGAQKYFEEIKVIPQTQPVNSSSTNK